MQVREAPFGYSVHAGRAGMPAGYKQSEVGVIPEDWKVEPILNIVSLPKGQVDPRQEPYKSMVLVAPDHIQEKTGRLLVKQTARDQNAVSGKYLFKDGDVVYSKIRPYLRKAILADFDGLCSADMYPLTPRNGASGGFVIEVLLGERFSEFAESVSARSGIPKINRAELAQYRLAIPPSKEQRAIAEALSDVDRLIGALDTLIAKKRAIKQAAMQQLLTGRTRLPGFSGKWETKRIGEFTDCTAGGTPSTLIPDYWNGSIRWMSSGELNQKIVYDVKERITERGLEESSAKLVPPRCVLIGLAGQGRTRGTVAMNMVELCTNQSIAAIYPNKTFVSEYLYANLDSRYDELRGMSTGDGGRGGLNLRIIRSIWVPFPSFDEQSAIATVLSDIDAEMLALEQRRDKTRAIKQGMMQQLLTGRIRLVIPKKQAVQA